MKSNLHNTTHSRSGAGSDSQQFLFGAEIVSLLIPERHPMMMVDRIISYYSAPYHHLIAERYISANEPALVGHFPDLKLWPGVLTIEGLKQACELLYVLQQQEEQNLLDDFSVLQGGFRLRQKGDEALYQRLLEALEDTRRLDPTSLTLRIKLLAPVFAGCVLVYQIQQHQTNSQKWLVQAEVDGRPAAKGEIIWRRIAG